MKNLNQINEDKKLLALYDIGLLDSGADERFDRLTRIALKLFDVPMAFVTFIDDERQYHKSLCGVELQSPEIRGPFCDWIVNTSQPMIIEDTLLDPRFTNYPMVTGYPFIRFYAGYPLRLPDGVNAGAICVMDCHPRSFSREDITVLSDLAGIVEDELKLLQLATEDYLTELLNRRSYSLIVEQTYQNAMSTMSTFSVIIIDLNDFKLINDTYGHYEGNRALKAFSAILKKCTSENHIIGRLGGDEFSILLTEGSEEDAQKIVGNLFMAVSNLNQSGALSCDLSFAAGIAQFDAGKHFVATDIMKEADEKMYAVKNNKLMSHS